MDDTEGGHLVIHKGANRLGLLYAFPVELHPAGEFLGLADMKAQCADPFLTGRGKAGGLGAGHPQGRVGFLDRLGNDRAGRNLEIPPFVRKRIFEPHPWDNRDGFFPHGLGLFRINPEAFHLDQRGRAARTEFDPAVAQQVEDRGTLRHTDRMIVLGRQQRDGMTDPDGLGPLRDRPV